MMTAAAFRKLALALPEAIELPHFERTSFRVGKKIFATMTAAGDEAMVRVYPLEHCFALLQSEPEMFFSYGGWTDRNGALGVHLRKADAKLIAELLAQAWERVAPRQPSRISRKGLK